MRAQMGNVLAEGNKKCLEIKGKIPKSSKHLIWGTLLNELYKYFAYSPFPINFDLLERK